MTPTVWVRPRQGPNLADLISQPGTTRAAGDADPIDVLGSAYAATDGDPRTAWTAPQRVAQHRTPPNLTLTLPAAEEVTALRVTPSSSMLPAHPKLVAIDLGDGPQVRPLSSDGGAQTVALRPRVTDTVKVSILDWDDVIDRTALGFDQIKPPGLAEITALDRRGQPIAAADAARNRERAVALPCGRGPIIAVAGRFIQTSIDTTVGALLDGDPVPARPCQAGPDRAAHRPAGTADQPRRGLRRRRRTARRAVGSSIGQALQRYPVETETWSADRREVDVPASQASRILVVPESINPGWTASTSDGTRLSPVTVNGWQQGWVVPAGTSGTVTLSFGSNAVYRAGIAGGLALLPILALLALAPVRRRTAGRRPGAAMAARPVAAGVAIAGRRRGRSRASRGRRGGCGARRPLRAVQSAETERRDHRRHQRGRADPGRRGVVTEPVAVGRRLRRALCGRPIAGADLRRRSGGIGVGNLASAECRNSIPLEETSTPPTSV